MLIANPLYDVVFKYLLDDTDIVIELLSTILGEEVISVDFKPQEIATESPGSSVFIMRFDFKAVIRTSDGKQKKVLVELQKAKQVFDVARFRKYLGENYRREDDVFIDHGISEKRPLLIVTIYLLGFRLENIQQPAVKINREYRDAITNELIEVKEDFVELLTHDSYVIQVPRLKIQTRTKLERALQIFSQEFQTSDPHQLDFQGDSDDPLVKKMIIRLGRAITNDEIRNVMDVEDEIDRIFERGYKKLANDKDKIISEKDQKLAEKDQKLAEKDQVIEVERQKMEDMARQIETLKRQLNQ